MRAERERERKRNGEREREREDRRRREWLKRRIMEVCVREREATGVTGKEENGILVLASCKVVGLNIQPCVSVTHVIRLPFGVGFF
jgi:hypothetical protein